MPAEPNWMQFILNALKKQDGCQSIMLIHGENIYETYGYAETLAKTLYVAVGFFYI